MPAFYELPQEERMRLRGVIEDNGGEVMAYHGEFVQVAIPRARGDQSVNAFSDALEAAGLLYVQDTAFYFPLGTDVPSHEQLRHDGHYRGSRGFWLFGLFRPCEGNKG